MYKKKILIVSDKLNMLELLNFILGRDYEIIIKGNGFDALTWLEEGNDPDLIISGIKMPYFSGSLFIKNLKVSGLYRDTPVIIVSGVSNLEEVVNSLSGKVNAYFAKPFNPVLLKQSVASLLA